MSIADNVFHLDYERPYLYPKQHAAIFEPKRISLVEASTKAGKAQPLDAIVWTPSGPRRMGDMRVGDLVLTPSGASPIRAIYPQGQRQSVKITFRDGTEVRCDVDHLWEVHTDKRDYRRGFEYRLKRGEVRRRKDFKGWPRVITTSQLMAYSEKRLKRMWVPEIDPVVFSNDPAVPLDPYLIGVLIGDGGMSGEATRLSSADPEIVESVRAALPPGHFLEKCPGDNVDWSITAKREGARHREAGTHIRKALRELGLLCRSHEKRIPECYLRGSIATRWAMLQGILDTDGSVDSRGQPLLEQTSPDLARDVTELVQSLGGTVYTHLKMRSGYRDANGKFVVCRPVFRQSIRFAGAVKCFRLARKLSQTMVRKRRCYRGFESIELDGIVPMQCIEIADERGLYLTDGFVPTHNTSGCITWIVELALSAAPGQNFWWVAPVSDQAVIAFRRAMRALPHDVYTANLSYKTITLINGAVLWFKSGDKPNSLYGEDVYGVVIDEASRMKEDAYIAIRSTVTFTRAPIRIIGNVRGRKNWFFKMARRAEHGDPEMGYHKIVASDAVAAGVLDAKEIEDARAQLPEQSFRELYLAEASDDGGNPFGLQHIAGCVVPTLSVGPPVVWGWDLAKRQDYTVGIALDRAGYVCRFERFQHIPWDHILNNIVRCTGNTPALVDSTGVGDPIVDFLQKKPATQFEGYHFTQSSKQKLMEGLSVTIQSRGVTFPPGVLVQELEQFEFAYTRTGVRYSAPAGYNDDCVCALALAVMHKANTKPALNITPEMIAQVAASGGGRRRH